MSIFDLHMHSNISRDGTYTPEELIQIAKNSGLKVVALSDHNDMHGIDRMIEAGKNENIQVILDMDGYIDEYLIDQNSYKFPQDIETVMKNKINDYLFELFKDSVTVKYLENHGHIQS